MSSREDLLEEVKKLNREKQLLEIVLTREDYVDMREVSGAKTPFFTNQLELKRIQWGKRKAEK